MGLIGKLAFAMTALALSACSNNTMDVQVNPPRRTTFFDKHAMDTAISPGENFFLYANGNWIKKTIIPPTETGWGTFHILWDSNQNKIHNILNYAAEHDEIAGSINQKVGDLYKSGMNTITIEKLGFDPVKPMLAKIDAVKNYKDFIGLVADGFKTGNGFLFGLYAAPDDKNSNKNMAHFDQAGLSLPNRDYYFQQDSASKKIRNEFVKYISSLYILIGIEKENAIKKALSVLKLETAIAASHLREEQLRDPLKNYNKFSVADFQKQMPDIDLRDVFARIGLKSDSILVRQPAYYKTLDTILKTWPLDVWKNKALFECLNKASEFLSKKFRDARFDFFGKILWGQKQQRDRWKTVSGNIDGGLGELVGQLYVEKYFPPEAKQRMLELVNNLQKTFRMRIEKLYWMEDSTKKRAIAKLDTMRKKIGYPDKWKTYDDVIIRKDAYYENQISIAKHNYLDMMQKIDRPVDKSAWNLTPQTIDAFYSNNLNEMVFPAGILQFPFFDKDADDAINYGAIGWVIGHEMTHGFDDKGRQYDKDGNLKDWWTKRDADQFKKLAIMVIEQYNHYTVLNDLHVNGDLTLGENIADIGGLAIAYEAFKNTVEGKNNTTIDGLTADQRFFLSVAQVWRSKFTDESLRANISRNAHSPAMFRVNGPVSNMDAFYKAFNIRQGDQMFRSEEKRVKIW